jgi:hypothetical protein
LSAGDGTPTFTRATTATTVDYTGKIISVSSGTARSYYDPTSLAYLGYLAEEQRTNICLRSEALDNAVWAKSRSSATADATIAPDGNTTADALTEDSTASNTHVAVQTVTATAAVYTWSVFAKAKGRSWVFLFTNDGTTQRSAYLQLSGTGVVGTLSNATATIQAFPNGWYRCSMTSTANYAAASTNLQIGPATADNTGGYSGDGASGLYLWGAQFEAGSFATSYIPTIAASVTRNADVLTYAGTGNASGTEGSAAATVVAPGAIPSAASTIIVALGASGFCGSQLGTGKALIYDGTAGTSTGSALATASTRLAWFWSAGASTKGAYNGGSGTSGSFDGDMTLGTLAIGCNSSGNNSFNGCIKSVRIWTAALPDAQLQTITSY